MNGGTGGAILPGGNFFNTLQNHTPSANSCTPLLCSNCCTQVRLETAHIKMLQREKSIKRGVFRRISQHLPNTGTKRRETAAYISVAFKNIKYVTKKLREHRHHSARALQSAKGQSLAKRNAWAKTGLWTGDGPDKARLKARLKELADGK